MSRQNSLLFMDKNQILKVRNQIIMDSNFCPSPNSPSVLDSDCPSSNITLKALNNNLFANDMASRQQKSDEDVENSKHTMESLCKSFIKKYQNSQALFEPTALANDFNAKLRRVYDMINILEGGGIIQKIDKGSYKWSTKTYQEIEIYREKNDWSCLKNISSQLKELFESRDKELTCHQIYQILTSQRKGKFNPATIRRRIYECCKVFCLAGIIQKLGKKYYNPKLINQDIQQLATKETRLQQDKNQIQNRQNQKSQPTHKNNPKKLIKLLEKNSKQEAKRASKMKQERNSLLMKIVGQLNSEQDLFKFIEELTLEFKRKNAQTEQVYQEVKIDEQSEFIYPNNYSWVQNNKIGLFKRKQSEKTYLSCQNSKDAYFSPQNNRKTFIISSPDKDKVSFMFSPNSSFCSFPSNSNLGNFFIVKPAYDIKGN